MVYRWEAIILHHGIENTVVNPINETYTLGARWKASGMALVPTAKLSLVLDALARNNVPVLQVPMFFPVSLFFILHANINYYFLAAFLKGLCHGF